MPKKPPHQTQVCITIMVFFISSGNYTNQENEDPNLFLQQTDYKLTPVRKRKNE